jgi:hypothetical protein
MKCKEHLRYTATRHPVKTQKYPDGCPTCWGVWEDAKTNAKRRAKTVTVEFDPLEARRLLLLLTQSRPVAALERLYQLAATVNPVEARSLTNSVMGVYTQLDKLKMLLAISLKEMT